MPNEQNLIPNSERSPEELREMAARRQPLYALACDTAIENNAAPETAAERIREDFYEAACH